MWHWNDPKISSAPEQFLHSNGALEVSGCSLNRDTEGDWEILCPAFALTLLPLLVWLKNLTRHRISKWINVCRNCSLLSPAIIIGIYMFHLNLFHHYLHIWCLMWSEMMQNPEIGWSISSCSWGLSSLKVAWKKTEHPLLCTVFSQRPDQNMLKFRCIFLSVRLSFETVSKPCLTTQRNFPMDQLKLTHMKDLPKVVMPSEQIPQAWGSLLLA